MSKRTGEEKRVSRVEMLRARVTYTGSGFPADLSVVEDCYGRRVSPSTDAGWFWIGASERSAADIRRRGLKVVGDLITSYVPADDGRPEEEVAVANSPEWVALMLEETFQADGPHAEGAGGYFYADAPEQPTNAKGGPLRKVIVFRLREVPREAREEVPS